MVNGEVRPNTARSFPSSSIGHTSYWSLPRQLVDGPGDQSRDDPCSENEELADDDIHEILFRFLKLLGIPLRSDEKKARDDKKKRDDRKRYHRERLQCAGEEFGNRAEVEGILQRSLRRRTLCFRNERHRYKKRRGRKCVRCYDMCDASSHCPSICANS